VILKPHRKDRKSSVAKENIVFEPWVQTYEDYDKLFYAFMWLKFKCKGFKHIET